MNFSINIFVALLTLKMSYTVMADENVPCNPISVRNCPGFDSRAELLGVYIEGCTEQPCSFKRGQDVGMEMDIRFKEPVQSIHAELHAVVLGLPIKWDGVNPKACEDIVSEGDCPFEESDYITYGVKLHVNQAYPPVSADVRYTVRDQSDNVQVCWIVRASVE